MFVLDNDFFFFFVCSSNSNSNPNHTISIGYKNVLSCNRATGISVQRNRHGLITIWLVLEMNQMSLNSLLGFYFCYDYFPFRLSLWATNAVDDFFLRPFSWCALLFLHEINNVSYCYFLLAVIALRLALVYWSYYTERKSVIICFNVTKG